MQEKILNNLKSVKKKAATHTANTSLFMKSLYPVEKYVQESEEIVNDCFIRHDVPQGPHVPVDLADVKGDLLTNSEGYPVAGLIPMEYMALGGMSPAAALFTGFFTFALALGNILAALHFPTLGFAVILGYAIIFFQIFSGMDVVLFIVAAFLGVSTYIPTLFNISANTTAAIHSSHLLTFMTYALPALIPTYLGRRESKRLAKRLGEVANNFNGPLISDLRATQKEARYIQVANAINDDSYVGTIAEATGSFSKHGDPFAPDEAKPFRMSLRDLSLSIIFFGRPGSGKTTALRNFLKIIDLEEIWISIIKTIPDFRELSEPEKEELRREAEEQFAQEIKAKNLIKVQEKQSVAKMALLKSEAVETLKNERMRMTNRKKLSKREELDIEYMIDALMIQELAVLKNKQQQQGA